MPPLHLYARVRIPLAQLHTRPRVQRAPGIPCALRFFRRVSTMHHSGANRAARTINHAVLIARSVSDEAIGIGRVGKGAERAVPTAGRQSQAMVGTLRFAHPTSLSPGRHRNTTGAIARSNATTQSKTAYSMLGSTRSGGLWLSRKVRMLMMTFSPISTRPSMVAEPMCGSSVTLPALASRTSFGFTAGSCS